MYQEDIYKLSPNEWEYFAQDVLFHLGFTVLVGPSEGADDGLDMVVEHGDVKYLVSCKHNHKSRKNIGVRDEADIRDRVEQHKCNGFIVFYSVGATTALKRKLISLKDTGISVIEIYLDNVLDIIPTMMGFVLQKYFQRPQELHHHLVENSDYKPLKCMKAGCTIDIISKENISFSLAGFCVDAEEIIHFIFGCKTCVADYCTHPYWAEIGQIRYIEQMLAWRSIVDVVISENKPAPDFYKQWALLQEAILQIQVPQGWGRWI